MQNNLRPQTVGVILMTYGSATTAEHVDSYMTHIYKDKVPKGIVEDFTERYRLVGSSPLVEITKDQAAQLEKVLNSPNDKDRPHFVVRAGMLHSEPLIDAAVAECRDTGAKHIVGIILSPQFSSFIMEGYRTALQAAATNCGYTESDLIISGPWPTEPHFIELLANRVHEKLTKLRSLYGSVPVVFTTHSLPERVVAKDPHYLDQLKATTDAVVAKLNDQKMEWYAAYQSAGHTPEPWLKPDLVDILARLRDKHDKAVLIVPIQFLADHLEILYDLDLAAREQCQEYGISYNRIELPNTASLFIDALAAVVENIQN